MSSIDRRAGQFFLEVATLLYDDLARRAECDGANEALVRRQASAARRLVNLIDRHGDEHWKEQKGRLCSEVGRYSA